MSEQPLRLVKNDKTSGNDPKDEPIDPELVSLRRTPRVRPMLSVSVLGLSLVLLFKLRGDIGYSLASGTPLELQAKTLDPAALVADTYVRLHGDLDLSAPARVRGGQTDAGYRYAPVQGTSSNLWLHEEGEAIRVDADYTGAFVGRLRRLDELSTGAELRAYVASLPPQPRYVAASALATTAPTRDVLGDTLTLAPDTHVTIQERVAGAALITQVKTDEIPTLTAAVKALTDAGLAPTQVSNEVDDPAELGWRFEVASSVEDARAKLRAAKMFGAAAAPKILLHEGKVADLHPGASIGLGAETIPAANIEHVVFAVSPTIPAGAWVVLEGETPASYWYMKPLAGVLAVMALLMAWASVYSLRKLMRERRHPSPRLVEPDTTGE